MNKFKFKVKNKVSFKDYRVYLVNEGEGIGFASNITLDDRDNRIFVLFDDGSFGFHGVNQFDLTPIEVTKVTYKEKA